MIDKKNIILAFGNKEFNNSLSELKEYLSFNLQTIDNLQDCETLKNYQGLIIHEDALNNKKFKEVIKDQKINKIVFHSSKKIKIAANIEKLNIPASFNQIDKIVINNIVKKKFKANSSLAINSYILDKNLRRLTKNEIFLELTEKEIELIELLKKNSFTKKKEILSIIWKYSKDADTHTVETHIYRLRKKIKDVFNDQNFIRSETNGYTI
tara:strand:- start:827 stop:1456 length:630 start_codon:yes stop_codon:yes gene_type:complete